MADRPEGARPPLVARGDFVGGTALFALAVAAWLASRGLPFGTMNRPGAGFFPTILSLALAAFSLIVVVRSLSQTSVDLRHFARTPDANRRVALMIMIALVAVAIVEFVGFPITVALMCTAMAHLVGGQSWRVTLPFGIGAGAACWLVFMHYLRVSLPIGILFD